jgi:hypothetical protein
MKSIKPWPKDVEVFNCIRELFGGSIESFLSEPQVIESIVILLHCTSDNKTIKIILVCVDSL